MNRQEAKENLVLLFYVVMCCSVVLVFLIPALICRLVYDRSVNR